MKKIISILTITLLLSPPLLFALDDEKQNNDTEMLYKIDDKMDNDDNLQIKSNEDMDSKKNMKDPDKDENMGDMKDNTDMQNTDNNE